MKLKEKLAEDYVDIDPPFANEVYELSNRQLERIEMKAYIAGFEKALELALSSGCTQPAIKKSICCSYCEANILQLGEEEV